MRLVMMGPPGSGKTVQACLVAEKLSVPHVDIVTMLKDAAQEPENKLGQKANYYVVRGQAVPDEVMVDLLERRLLKMDCKDGCILEGFPKTTTQATRLASIFKMRRWPFRAAVNLMVDQEKILRRICGRRFCDQCGMEFNIYYSAPKAEATCDACAGTLFQRKEDREDLVLKNVTEYKREIAPLEVNFRQKAQLIEIDANGSVQDVFRALCDALRI